MIAIDIAISDSLDDALSALPPEQLRASPLLLPTSGRRQDPAVASIRRQLRTIGVDSSVLLPGGLVSLAPFTQPEGGAWQSATINVPGQPGMAVSLPSRLLSSQETWIVIDVDAVAGRGPHVLDLAARYLRHTDRLRGLRTRERTWVVAVNSLLNVTRLVGTANLDGLAVATSTRDLVAGELLALAMAGLHLPQSSSVTGVWEDPLVQRATELQLGVLYPGQLSPNVTIAAESTRAIGIANQILTAMGVLPS
jgi:hypothetical protein